MHKDKKKSNWRFIFHYFFERSSALKQRKTYLCSDDRTKTEPIAGGLCLERKAGAH